jgi:acetyl esterase
MSVRSRIERAAARAIFVLPEPILRRLVGTPPRSADGLVLDLESQALRWMMRVRGDSDLHQGGLGRARRMMDRSGPILASLVGDVSGVDSTVSGAAGPRRSRIYRPLVARAGGAAPGLVFFHGGGFALGSIESHDGACRELASKAGVVVISVDYRLAPEHGFPAAVEDAIAATRAVLDGAELLGLAPGAVAVGGDSAGGNLAAVVAQALRGAPRRPAFQLLFYPVTDFTRPGASHRLFAEGFILTKASMDWFEENYLPVASRRDPRASPIFASDLSGLPPALVLTAGFDPLRDEGRAYAEAMRAAGAAVEYVCAEGSMHGFIHTSAGPPEASRMMDLAADRLRRALLPLSGNGVASAA